MFWVPDMASMNNFINFITLRLHICYIVFESSLQIQKYGKMWNIKNSELLGVVKSDAT